MTISGEKQKVKYLSLHRKIKFLFVHIWYNAMYVCPKHDIDSENNVLSHESCLLHAYLVLSSSEMNETSFESSHVMSKIVFR